MTAGERLKLLAGAGGAAASLLLSIGSGATAAEALADYSQLDTGTAAEHLLTDVQQVVVAPGASPKQLFTGVTAAEPRFYGYSATAYDGTLAPEAAAGIYPRTPAVVTSVAQMSPSAAGGRALKAPVTSIAAHGTITPDGGGTPPTVAPAVMTKCGTVIPATSAEVIYIRIGNTMVAKSGHVEVQAVKNPTDEELAILAVQLARRSRR